jgi:chemosensory pili system protein ChpA (sensor histidine kinase/response regulator)
MKLNQQILVVDDDDAIRALLQTVLRRRGFRVDAARNGVDALEQLAARAYALVVLDLMMPRMSGYDVLDHLSERPATARPRVLVLTASLAARAYSPELVIGTVHKPFDIELLLDIVAGFLSAGNEQTEPPAETVGLSSPN